MKRLIHSFFYLLLFTSLSTSSFATDTHADSLINKYIKAIGGVENWEKIKTIRILKHSNFSTDNLLLWSNTELVRDKGMQIASYINEGVPTIKAINNEEGWKIVNGHRDMNTKEEILWHSGQSSQISTLPDSTYQELKFISSIPWKLFDVAKHNIRLSYKGTIEINDEVFEQLDVKMKGMKAISCFFSTKDAYLEKVLIGRKLITFSDFKVVEGVVFPFRESIRFIKNKSSLSRYEVTRISTIDFITDKVILNPKIANENMVKPTN